MKNTFFGILFHNLNQMISLLVALFIFTLFSTSAQPVVAVGLAKMNVLYRGVDNPATIAVSGVEQADVKMTFNNGTFKNLANGYSLNPTRLGSAILTVFVKDKEVGKIEFRVKDLPDTDPVAKLGGQSNGSIKKSWLALQTILTAELDGTDFDFKFKIISFSVTAFLNGKKSVLVSNSEQFTNEQLELFKSLKSGDKLTISEIKASVPEGTARDLESLVFKIL